MKRQEKYPDTPFFHYHNANPKHRITGDCTFRAVATALDKAWSEAVMEMAEMSCRTGYACNDKKGISTYLKEQGWIMHKQPRHWYDNTKYTGAEFCNEIACHDVNYILSIGSGHLTCVIDGKINDIWDCSGDCVGNYWTKG